MNAFQNRRATQAKWTGVSSIWKNPTHGLGASVVHIHRTDGRFAVNWFFGIKDPQHMYSG